MEPEEPERVPTAEHRVRGGGRTAGTRRPRDRVWVHLVWEVLLAGAVVLAALAVRAEDAAAFGGDSLRDLLLTVAVGVLLGTAFALSLRAAVPNLAVGATAVAGGALTGWLVTERDYPLLTGALLTLGTAVALGLALTVVVVGFRSPAWAAGLGAALGLYAAVLALAGGQSLPVPGAPDLRPWAWPIVGGALLLSVGGGALGLLPGVRDTVGSYRPDRDPAAGRGSRAGFVAAGALVGSTVLAAGAGLLLALRAGAVIPDDGVTLLAAAAAAALLGGTSAYGRRGGVFGTALAAAFLQLAALWLGLVDAEAWTRPALLGGAIVVGLMVGRLVEAAGSPRLGGDDADDADDAEPEPAPDPYSTEAYTPYGTGTFDRPAYRRDDEPWWPGQAPPPGGQPPFRPDAGEPVSFRPAGPADQGPYRAGTAEQDPYRAGPADQDPNRAGPPEQDPYRAGAGEPTRRWTGPPGEPPGSPPR